MRGKVTLGMIHESNLIEGFDSEEMDTASRDAFTSFRGTVRARKSGGRGLYAIGMILSLHERVVSAQPNAESVWPGALRDRARTNVRVGGRLCPAYHLVPTLLDNWLFRVNAGELSPMEAHIEFEHIHPFVDGNGRVGRLLLWSMELDAGLDLTEITKENVRAYYSLF